MVNVRAILVTNLERATLTQEEAFAIDRDTRTARTFSAKPIACIVHTWNTEWNTIELKIWAKNIGVQTACIRSTRISNKMGSRYSTGTFAPEGSETVAVSFGVNVTSTL